MSPSENPNTSHGAALGELLMALALVPEQHVPGSPLYRLLERTARQQAVQLFSESSSQPAPLGPLGNVSLPYERMGTIDSLDLFGLDELILFSFYWANRTRYRRAVDIGANLGLHTIMLARCDFEVRAFEPDPTHFALLGRNAQINGLERVELNRQAVSNRAGKSQFVRVLGNTTSSHLAGSKQGAYGQLETFDVDVVEAGPLFQWADLVKLDAEGHEREILLATTAEDWRTVDALVEVGSPANADAIFAHAQRMGLWIFAQRLGWGQVHRVGDMPVSYRDGSLFLSARATRMPWPAARRSSEVA